MSADLKAGGTYFVIGFEDPTFRRPVIETYEFLRKELVADAAASGDSAYVFRIVGSDDELVLTEAQIWQALDVEALIRELTRFRDGQIR